jgi:hypothetical protein
MRAFGSLAEQTRTFGYFEVADQDVSLLGLTSNPHAVRCLHNIATGTFTIDWADAPKVDRRQLEVQPVVNAAH